MKFVIIFLVIVVILAFIPVGKQRKDYRIRKEPIWKHPSTKRAFSNNRLAPQARTCISSKIAQDGFRYDPEGEWPFLRRRLITDTESILFERLQQALPNHHIFTQVQLSQLVTVKKGHSFKMWFSRISQMSVDFVVADKELNTIAAIELDDKTHYSDEDRHRADAKKDKVLTAAGIRIIRWRCEIMPSAEQIALALPECRAVLPVLSPREETIVDVNQASPDYDEANRNLSQSNAG